MTDDDRAPDIPEPAVVDVRDWPPRSETDDAREELDREVGTLGVGGDPVPRFDPYEQPSDPGGSPERGEGSIR